MVRPPREAASFPADYADYLRRHPVDHVVGRSVIFGYPVDPGERLGRQGDENFCSSVLIGVREPTNIILRYVGDDPANAGHWRYGIVNGAESAIVAEFATLAELLAHLRPERPLPASRVPGMAKAKVTTKRRRS